MINCNYNYLWCIIYIYTKFIVYKFVFILFYLYFLYIYNFYLFNIDNSYITNKRVLIIVLIIVKINY